MNWFALFVLMAVGCLTLVLRYQSATIRALSVEITTMNGLLNQYRRRINMLEAENAEMSHQFNTRFDTTDRDVKN